MKKTWMLLLVVSTPAFGLNGLRPIGVSAASRSMGGTGVAAFNNYIEAIYRNPALMSHADHEVGTSEATFGMTYGSFNPRVRATYGEDQEYKRPQNRTAGFFPSGFGIGYKQSDFLSIGGGIYGGGGGADYSDSQSIYRAKSSTRAFSLIGGFSMALSSDFSVGLNGSITSVDTLATNESITKGTMVDTGGKDVVFGIMLGTSYVDGPLHLGASIQPKQQALLRDARDIDEDGEQDNLLFSAVPLEIGLGVSWQENFWSISADYRFLQWSKADFLNSVGWQDQHVAALGFELGREQGVRLGANFSTDAITDKFGTDGFATTETSEKPLINLAGDAFATTSALGTTNKHYTIGSFHKIGPSLIVETAYVHMDVGSLERAGAYKVPTGTKVYGWRSEFMASTVQIEATYVW